MLVTHDGERWLPGALRTLHVQRRPFQRLIVVDTGSLDRSREIAGQYLPESDILPLSRSTGFGAAVASGVEHTVRWVPPEGDDRVEWIWLLHDDCEPAPDALYHLLAAAEQEHNAAVVGPKVRGWYRRRMILEAGLTITRGGRRWTGLERGEQDQGQHDRQRDVLAVGSAGMLVRRDVWDKLGGFDPSFGLMRDDVDFCWRVRAAGHRVVLAPDAVVYHAEAAAQERREVATVHGRIHLLDRANAIRVLLVNLPLNVLPLAMARLAITSLLRAGGFLIGKLPGQAVDELLAPLVVLSRPGQLIRARRRRAKTRTAGYGTLRPYFPPLWQEIRHAVDLLAGSVVPGRGPVEAATPGRHRAVESGPVAEEAESLETGGAFAALMRQVRRPSVALALGLTLVTLLAGRELLGGGRLLGGALLPAPTGASDLWATYFATWHPVGVGSPAAAPPYLAVVALLATVLFGKANLAVAVLLLGSVPLAGLTAYLALSRLVSSWQLRVWGGAAYALLPAVTGAVAAGRLGTVVGIALLPLLAIGAAGLFRPPDQPEADRAAWASGLVLAIMTAFAASAWVVALLLAVVAMRTVARGNKVVRARLTFVLVTPILLLLPWSFRVIRHPSMLLLEAGLPGPGLADPDLSPLAVLLLNPGGPGLPPLWIGAALILAGLAALMRHDVRAPALAGWAIALSGFAVALIMSRLDLTGPAGTASSAAWPGFPTAVMAFGLLMAAAAAADNALERLAGRSFGIYQPIAALIAIFALAAPVLTAGWWVWQGAADPVRNGDPVLLPQHVAAEGGQPSAKLDRPRTLVLRTLGDGRIRYTLARDDGPRLGDGDMASTGPAYDELDTMIASMASGQGDIQVKKLVPYDIKYIYVPAPADRALVRTLDGLPEMYRIGAPDGAALWRLETPVSRVWLVSTKGVTVSIPAGPVGAEQELPASETGEPQLLALAEAIDKGWRATVEGKPVSPVIYPAAPWAEAFQVPAAGGRLRVEHHDPARLRWLVFQGLAVLLVVVLALPGGQRRPEDDEELFGGFAPSDRGDAQPAGVGPSGLGGSA